MIKSFMLMAAMTALFAFAGIAMGGVEGMIIALLFAIGMNAFAWYNSDKMVLRMYKAQSLPSSHPLTRMVSQLAENANLPMPKVYEIPNDQPNAFATGRNPENSAVSSPIFQYHYFLFSLIRFQGRVVSFPRHGEV